MILPTPLSPNEAKRLVDFLAVVARYGVRLRRAGSQYRGLCPFHDDSEPSFYVEPEQKIWKCFGCERGGDLFDFVMLAEQCDFPKALQVVSGIASGSSRRSRERIAASVRGEAPSARAAGSVDSRKYDGHAQAVARLCATERRLAGIARVNAAALAELAADCEPDIYTQTNNFPQGRSNGRC